jgi:predicted DCC family thiol-disulfide oxidoreductase YuxK
VSSAPVLLYDGTCGFCAASVRWVLQRDPSGPLQFAPLEGVFGAAVRARHASLAGVDSVVWVSPATDTRDEMVLVRSDAALRVCAYVGGVWGMVALLRMVPRPVRDAVYAFVARHRHRLVSNAADCLLPTPATRPRFLA